MTEFRILCDFADPPTPLHRTGMDLPHAIWRRTFV